jgi:dihydroxyacetone kinase
MNIPPHSPSVFSPSVPSPSVRAAQAVAAAAGGDLVVNSEPLFVRVASSVPERKVALVSGGGAGHEPLHIGFLGRGGLDAVCPGEVFTSPHSRQIYEAGRAVALPGGVLHIVKNYTGDLINFGIAAERLREAGLEVGTLIVRDDIGTASAVGTGMRGTAATLIVEKILGAAADAGASLDELLALGQSVVADSRSLAVAFAAHTDRETGRPAFTIDDGQFEFGVGIHGERAHSQIPAEDSTPLVRRMTRELLAAHPSRGPFIVLVNGLGGMSNLDLANVAADLLDVLEESDVQVESIVVGTFVSALDMRGFSLTFTTVSERWLPLWYAPHETPALPRPRPMRVTPGLPPSSSGRRRTSSPWAKDFAGRLISMRRPFNALDAAAGDGDFGDNLSRGLAAAIDDDVPSVDAAGPGDTAVTVDLRAFADAFLDDVGGSSGPLLGVLLQATASAAEDAADVSGGLARGLAAGAGAVSRVGGAQPGDRTMIDALAGFLSGELTTVDHAAAERALHAAEATSAMRPRRGRATYLADRIGDVPDAGALAVAALVIGLSERVDPRDHADLWARLDAVVNRGGTAGTATP